MRPIIPLILLALLLPGAAWCASRATRVYINGLPLRDSATGGPAAIIVKDGVTYVPLRAVAEALGCTVDYDPKAGVFIWGGHHSPQLPGLPSGPTSTPSPFPPNPRPKVPEPPSPGR
jgi:hypothetical protein